MKRASLPWWVPCLGSFLAALFVLASAAAEPESSSQAAPRVEAPVVVFNRLLTVYRSPLFGAPPQERARRTRARLQELLDRPGPGKVSVQSEPQGNVILIDGVLGLILTPNDADALSGESLDHATATARTALERVIAETRESRSREQLLRELLHVAIATLAFLLASFVILRTRGWLSRRIERALEKTAARTKVAKAALSQTRWFGVSRWFVRSLTTFLVVVLCYRWTSFVLNQFPYTRAWGEGLDDFLLGVVVRLGSGMLRALPDLLIALVIFLLARGLIGLVKPIFRGIEQGRFRLAGLEPDTARATRRIFSTVVWMFAGVMAYPYLPGSASEAFKGVSVLIGLMVTVGGSSLFGQAASGLILLYSRVVRLGELVRIGEQEGTVSELGAFTTKIRTGLGEEVTLPNALVLGSVTKNYSRPARGPGFVLDTSVSIGYDTPWRQVSALLVEAALRTPGVVPEPAPQVFQTALSDFYIEYRLVCQALQTEARQRAEAVAALNANVLDVFNERGVQIMSPHYLGDPSKPKVVPGKGASLPAAEPPVHSGG